MLGPADAAKPEFDRSLPAEAISTSETPIHLPTMLWRSPTDRMSSTAISFELRCSIPACAVARRVVTA